MQDVAKSPEITPSEQTTAHTISLKPLTDPQLRGQLETIVRRMGEIICEVDHIFSTTNNEYLAVIARLDALENKNILERNSQRLVTDESIKQYLQLLTLIKAEIDQEVSVLKKILSPEDGDFIVPGPREPQTFEEYIPNKVKSSRAQLKEIESSLKISFSRYQHWTAKSKSNLDHLERLARR